MEDNPMAWNNTKDKKMSSDLFNHRPENFREFIRERREEEEQGKIVDFFVDIQFRCWIAAKKPFKKLLPLLKMKVTLSAKNNDNNDNKREFATDVVTRNLLPSLCA